jgi:hypothetical protein
LLLDEEHELAVVIENKIYSGEHSDQLGRYQRLVSQNYPGWRLVCLFLTPSGEAPSLESYLPVDYGIVCEVLDGLVASRASVINPDVKSLLNHYTEMLRRHIVGDSEVARLARQIYHRHKRALDLIYEHRLGALAEIKEVVEGLIEAEPGFEVYSIVKNKTRFALLEWDQPGLLTAKGWSKSNRILLFEFWYYPDDLRLYLFIGPGPDEIRQKLFERVDSHPEVFRGSGHRGDYRAIYILTFLEGEEMHAEIEDRNGMIRRRWSEFLKEDLPRIDAALKEERWILGAVESDA